MIHEELQSFLAEWQLPVPDIEVQTSGSTGTPKRFRVKKQYMLNSAARTCSVLGLERGDKALLCMPVRFIAGKMMVVRALYAGLDLVVREPSGHPLADLEEPVRFAAMTPMQVYNSLQNENERRRLQEIEVLIIGGGAVSAELEAELAGFGNRIYATYGMTETLSHIALRRINGAEASLYFRPLDDVTLSLGDEQTLVIDAPGIADGTLRTNDVAELLPDGRFRILGRKDNIINSGGLKIQIEQTEALLEALIATPFALTAVPDARFGEALVLLIEAAETVPLPDADRLAAALPPFRVPKQILRVQQLPRTGNGKLDRAACRTLAQQVTTKL